MTNKTRKEKLVEEIAIELEGKIDLCEYDREQIADFVMKKEREAVEYVTRECYVVGDTKLDEQTILDVHKRAKVYLED